jgi:glycosyltransferase involved in cell wall biosynthesis
MSDVSPGAARPLVSICIPAFRRPLELLQAIDSVLGQQDVDLELVVSDDSGSLEPVVRQRDDRRIRYFTNDRRYGMALNWNLSLDRARGELIGLLMDDDRLHQQFLARVVAAFAADPSLDIVFSNHNFDAAGVLHVRQSRLAPGKYPSFLPTLLRCKPVAISAAVMRRRVWERIRPLPDLVTADMVMHVRACQLGCTFYYIDEPLMTYRLHPGQLSASDQSRDDQVKLWEMFSFDDPECERLRRSYLTHSLISQAAGRLRQGRFADARQAARRAREDSGVRLSARERAVVLAASNDVSARLAAWAWSATIAFRSRKGEARPQSPYQISPQPQTLEEEPRARN